MEYAIKERIGKPDLFTGRKEELDFFLKWINNIKQEQSQSTALLARRKMGKTAILERLFNITFFKNDGIIPFYFEINENKTWLVDFCQDFFLAFIYQYIAFKSRKTEYLKPTSRSNFLKAIEIAKRERLEYLCDIIEDVAYAVAHEKFDTLWKTVREVPQTIAFRQKEFVVQMIDEFQFLNAKICRDKAAEKPIGDLAAGYLSSAESKIAPLLISGSWVGWLMNDLISMLPSRFRYEYLEPLPENEAAEMIYKYSHYFDVPVTEETVYLMAHMAEGSPFYISSIMRSSFRKKDLTTISGLTDTLEFETLNDRGAIKSTWMEYIAGAFPQINDRNAKNVVLYLCKHRDRELTREEIISDLNLDISDADLEKKLKALIKADIITQGQTNFDYRAVQDNIFDKVFRGVYEKEIRAFDVRVIKKEYREQFELLKQEYHSLLGKYNYLKGYYTEYAILDQLRMHACANNLSFKSITRNLPVDFNFCEYVRVWRYDSSPAYTKRFSVDIFARAAAPSDYSIIGEVKSRDTRKFSKEELVAFERKFENVKEYEKIDRAIGFIFSRSGFTEEATAYCREKGIACSEDERWLGTDE